MTKNPGAIQIEIIDAIRTMFANGEQFKEQDIHELLPHLNKGTINKTLHLWERNALGKRNSRRATGGLRLVSTGNMLGRRWRVLPHGVKVDPEPKPTGLTTKPDAIQGTVFTYTPPVTATPTPPTPPDGGPKVFSAVGKTRGGTIIVRGADGILWALAPMN